jgi:hypothetical protein
MHYGFAVTKQVSKMIEEDNSQAANATRTATAKALQSVPKQNDAPESGTTGKKKAEGPKQQTKISNFFQKK